MKKEVEIKGIVHITGGGFTENVPRVLPDNVDVIIDKNSYPVLPVFKMMQKLGNIEDEEMYRTFNMGIGMMMVVNAADAEKAVAKLNSIGEKAYIIGKVVEGNKVCKTV